MPIDLEKVRSLFENLAKMENSRFLTREVASRLRERLAVMKIDPARVLDAGCGDGGDLEFLSCRFPTSEVFGMDASLAMLRYADKYLNNNVHTVCGNFSLLPFNRCRFDMIWSNLALHWHQDIAQVFGEWESVLKEDGLLIFSCFGSKTLEDLRASFEGVDGYSHVLPFNSMLDLGNALVAAGFAAPVLEREWINVTYTNTEKLLADVRALGGNPLADRPKGLFGKRQHERLLENLNARRIGDGLLTLRFEVIYAHAFKEKRSRNEEKIVSIFR